MLWKQQIRCFFEAIVCGILFCFVLLFCVGGEGVFNAIITLYCFKILLSSNQSGRKYPILVIYQYYDSC